MPGGDGTGPLGRGSITEEAGDTVRVSVMPAMESVEDQAGPWIEKRLWAKSRERSGLGHRFCWFIPEGDAAGAKKGA